MLGPIIEGERVRLVPPTPEMLPTFCRWFANTEVTRYLGLAYPPTLKREEEWFENMARDPSEILWATFATDGDNERLLGTTGLTINWQNRRATSGNVLGEKSEWNKGYGTQIVQLRTDYAFLNLPIEKIASSTFAENLGSRRVLEKAGYQTVGVSRHDVFRHGRWHDTWLCEILRGEWDAMRQ